MTKDQMESHECVLAKICWRADVDVACEGKVSLCKIKVTHGRCLKVALLSIFEYSKAFDVCGRFHCFICSFDSGHLLIFTSFQLRPHCAVLPDKQVMCHPPSLSYSLCN